MQYFVGLHEFHAEPLFDPSMMVHFRKRFPVEEVAKINEYVCTGKWPEEQRNVDRNNDTNHGDEPPAPLCGDGESGARPAKQKCREHLETAVNKLWERVPHNCHKLPYSVKKARKSYLKLAKSKKWGQAKCRKAIGEQLRYIELASGQLQKYASIVPDREKLFPR